MGRTVMLSALACAGGAVLLFVAMAACGSSGTSSEFPGGAGGGGGAGGSGPDASLMFGDGATATPKALFFDPPEATVTIDGTASRTVKLTLKAETADHRVFDVTAQSVEFDRPDLATVTEGEPMTLTAPPSAALYGGTGTVHALYAGKEATAKLTVRVRVALYGPGLGPSSPAVAQLNGKSLPADPAAGTHALLYPYDGTVWPLGLTSPLVMWSAPQAGDVYRLRYVEKDYEVDAYATLGALPGQMRLDQATWDRMTASNQAASGKDPLTFTLSRWDHTTGKAYAGASQTWTVAPESLRGAIYYWTASRAPDGTSEGHITKFQPGTGAHPVVLNSGKCMGCHAVNARGTVLVADVDDGAENQTPPGMHTVPSVPPYGNWSGTRAWASFDVTKPSAPEMLQTTKFGADLALTPDGKYVVFGGQTSAPGSKYISLGVVATGAVVTTSGLDAVTGFDPALRNLMMPAFSPDGTKLAVVVSPGDLQDNVLPTIPSPNNDKLTETIAYLDFDESGPTFSPKLHMVVDSSSSAFATTGPGLAYPSFSPDSGALAFHAGTYSTGCNVNGCVDTTQDNGDLFMVTTTGAPPIRLAEADDPPNAADRFSSVEPTFNPDVRGGYAWAVFTSMRTWGNQPWPADITQSYLVNGKRRLWLTAVDAVLGTSDPSHPAIYLEGQADTPNMRAFWTMAPCKETTQPKKKTPDPVVECTAGFECCSGFCENGRCVGPGKETCSGVGGACKSAADCCNAGQIQCIENACVIPIPK